MSEEARKPRGRVATQKDVAERAGVSLSIVSYVINNGPRSVSEETRQRVLQAIRELDYRPNRTARKLISNKWQTNTLQEFGVVLGGGLQMLTRPFYGSLLNGIYHEAHQQGLRVRFTQFIEELRDPMMFNELIHPDEISGLILVSINLSLPYWDSFPDAGTLLEKMCERIDNVVCVERAWGQLPAVVFDRTDAARKAINHLVQLGHRRIAFIGAPDERLDSYQRTMQQLRLITNPDLVFASRAHNSAEEGCKGVIHLLNLPERPTAIFTASDEVAIGALGALQRHGVAVPEDMALVSIDDIELASYVHPTLTTVHVPQSNMGIHTVRLLKDCADNPEMRSSPMRLVLPADLVVRESCGAHLQRPPVK